MWNVNDIRAKFFFFSSIRGILVNFDIRITIPPLFEETFICRMPRTRCFRVTGCSRFGLHPHLTRLFVGTISLERRSKRGFTKRRGRIGWKLKLKEDSRMCESNARLIREREG